MSAPLSARGIVIPHFLEPIDLADCEFPIAGSNVTHDIDPIILIYTPRGTDEDIEHGRALLKIMGSNMCGSFQSMSRRADGRMELVSDPNRTGGFGFSEFEVEIRDTLTLSLKDIVLREPEDDKVSKKAYLNIKGAGGWKQKTGKQKRRW